MIGAYERLTPFQTTGSGSARWCVAMRDGERYFLKQFLSPVRPSPADDPPLAALRLARCERFARDRERLYFSVSRAEDDTCARVRELFCDRGHYYAASEYVPPPWETGETARALPPAQLAAVLYALAVCLQRLHGQGVVYADLKPEHLLLVPDGAGGLRLRLIDFDSGFHEDAPPDDGRAPEGDPVYLAPETLLRMRDGDGRVMRAADVFALGLVIHRLWTGELPRFPKRYLYPHEAALRGARLRTRRALPRPYRALVRRMLRRDPAQRPSDEEIVKVMGRGVRDEDVGALPQTPAES